MPLHQSAAATEFRYSKLRLKAGSVIRLPTQMDGVAKDATWYSPARNAGSATSTAEYTETRAPPTATGRRIAHAGGRVDITS